MKVSEGQRFGCCCHDEKLDAMWVVSAQLAVRRLGRRVFADQSCVDRAGESTANQSLHGVGLNVPFSPVACSAFFTSTVGPVVHDNTYDLDMTSP